jgi:hypothetical protein
MASVDKPGKVYYRINAIERRFPEHIEIYLPKFSIKKSLPDSSPKKKQKQEPEKKETKETTDEDILRSIRRSRKRIREIVLCNDFNLFVTFTFKSDRHDITKCQAKMSSWLKSQNKKNSFEYLIIPELHKDGALHFHGLLKNYSGKLIDSGKQTRFGQPIFNVESYRSGFTTAVKFPAQDLRLVGHYITKYITKDMPRFSGKKRYWASKNLKEPRIIENPAPWFIEIKPSVKIETVWGRFLYFSTGRKYES